MEENKLETEISEKFLKEYRELCHKYNRDFMIETPIPKIIKVEFMENKQNDFS
ncbi:MAG: hypothetical protein PHT54_03550 [Candidatus Nanoarchaeia archaeon]|nr:hypothetical protein [Candidatus Nanoarchaeia archaeon]